MSFLPDKRRGKKSATKRFRISPYPTASSSSLSDAGNSGFIRAAPKALSAQAFDRESHKFQQAYQEMIQDYTDMQRRGLQTIRDEIGWDGENPEVGRGSQLELDSDSDLADEEEDGFHSITLSIARRAGVNKVRQSWAERLDQERQSWLPEMPGLCAAILKFTRSGQPPVSSTPESEQPETVSITCIELTAKVTREFAKSSPVVSIVQTLARHGYIATTPRSPSCAIHVDLLRYCAALRRHAPTASLQSIATAICETMYVRHFRTQLTGALDIFLEIGRMIDARLAKVMSREGEDWRMANACAACSYRLKDEPSLLHSALFTCDGNDSLKRVANASAVDRRIYEDSYFLPSEYVDCFENEVARKPRTEGGSKSRSKSTHTEQETHSEPELLPAALEDGSTSTSDKGQAGTPPTKCEERWKNAHADKDAQRVVAFDETGIFAVSCRHGTVMLVEDMRQSGELAKYGLAAVAKLVRVFGDNILIGYDIGCTFSGTARRSPLVGPLVEKHNVNFVVGSFHGYAHNRKCQLKNHPLNVEGAGLEAFEENEQLFSSTNKVAITTRYASPFHRRQLISLRVGAWDFGRRLALGSVLKSRYKTALEVLSSLPKEIKKLCPGKTDDDWKRMFREECEYFESLKNASVESSFAMLYLRRLRLLAEKQKAYDEVFKIKITYTLPSQIDQYRNHPTIQNTAKEHQYQRTFEMCTRQLETRRTTATDQLLAIQTEVARMEEERGIHPRWEPGCQEWEEATKREALETFYEALRDLEGLVVQRLAEFEKAHAVGTGYKARMQIAKGIKRREKAVHSALKRYNSAALALTPPRPTLKFSDLSEYAYLSDFEFLKNSEHGALTAEWTQPANRRCIASWQKIQRATEEIARLNVEIRRVRTHIRDEEIFLSRHYTQLRSSDPDLAHALLARMEITVRVNKQILHDLDSITKLRGFTGQADCGVHIDAEPEVAPLSPSLTCLDSPAVGRRTYELADTLAALRLESTELDMSDTDSSGDEGVEVEPSDESQEQMSVYEQSCKVM